MVTLVAVSVRLSGDARLKSETFRANTGAPSLSRFVFSIPILGGIEWLPSSSDGAATTTAGGECETGSEL